jgi:hypothetical protein
MIIFYQNMGITQQGGNKDEAVYLFNLLSTFLRTTHSGACRYLADRP